jgi:putative oxidoreductase
MNNVEKFAELLGRILLAAIFVISGIHKIGNYAATQQFMTSAGVPGELLPLVILIEVGIGLAFVFGLFTRISAAVIGAFSIAAGALFHGNLHDQTQAIMFWKDVAIAGGFMIVAARGAGPWSLDRRMDLS